MKKQKNKEETYRSDREEINNASMGAREREELRSRRKNEQKRDRNERE